eukprot:TRINITY_DN618_c1_g4_i1.p1 TRINITY_DN618_c1_g4~~TRINITY_DN618_c1_g4_i1.p1  ORF type:complete len:1290 (+),score=350.96 TRINITY_DN618_c1_g4_i1:106-3975(+)
MCRMCLVMTCERRGVLLADVILRPSMSIVRQSFCSQERAKMPNGMLPVLSYQQHSLNGDGFGVGWYSEEHDCPCVFTSVKPAWNDTNLEQLSERIRSNIVLAHVRAAGPGTPVSEAQCHPFKAGRFMFMHNGLLGDFSKTRRHLIMMLDEQAFSLSMTHSSIDSVVTFALFLTLLVKKHPMKGGWTGKYNPSDLYEAMDETCSIITQANAQFGVQGPSLMNFVVTDGECVVATRIVDVPGHASDWSGYESEDSKSLDYDDEEEDDTFREKPNAASLYLSTGSVWKPKSTSKNASGGVSYHMEQRDRCNRTVLVSSEPLSDARDEWMAVPTNTIVLCTVGKAVIDICFIPFPRRQVISKALLEPTEGGEVERLTCSAMDLSALYDDSQPFLPSRGSDPGDPVPARASLSFKHLQDTITCIATCRDQQHAISGAHDGSVVFWDLKVSSHSEPRRHPGPVLALLADDAATPDRLLFSTSHNELRVWNISHLFADPRGAVPVCMYVFKFAPSQGALLSLCGGAEKLYIGTQTCQVLSLTLAKHRAQLDGTKTRSKRMRFFKIDVDKVNKRSVLSALARRRINGSCNSTPGSEGLVSPRSPLSVPSPQGSFCETKGPQQKFKTEDIVAIIGDHHAHRGFVYAMCESGTALVTCGGDGNLCVWEEDELAGVLVGHTGGVVTVVHHQENRVVSGSFDSTIREWDIKRRCCLRALRRGVGTPVLTVVSLGGHLICSAVNGDGQRDVSLWVMFDDSTATHHELDGQQVPLSPTVLQGVSHDSGALVFASGDTKGPLRLTTLDCNRLLPTDSPRGAVAKAVGQSPTEETISMLREFVGIRSISSDPAHARDCYNAARWVAAQYERIGCTVITHTTRSHPVVIGRLGFDPALPTVMLYSHYDVVPPGSGWKLGDTEISPWDLIGEDGFLYGRGSTDNKGPMIAQLRAVHGLNQKKELKVNVVFVCEGDEENMSQASLVSALQKAKASNLLENIAAVVLTNSNWIDDSNPCICYGARGVVDMGVKVSGPREELHSGCHGGYVAEPVHDLLGILSQIVSPDGHVPIPNFYADVKRASEHDEEALLKAAQAMDLDHFKDEIGIPGFKGDSEGYRQPHGLDTNISLLRKNWLQPTVSITNIETQQSDRTAPATSCEDVSRKQRRAIAAVAIGHLSFRIVPAQTKQSVEAAVASHLKYEFARRRTPNSLSITTHAHAPHWEGDVTSHVFQVASEAVEAVYGKKPLMVREGGTLSILTVMQDLLKVPVVQIPLGQSSDRMHLPNERIRVSNLMLGVDVISELLKRY